MEGSLLFYTPPANDFVGHVICRTTHGPYCHVAIHMGDDTQIEAVHTGVRRVPFREPSALYTPTPASALQLHLALAWLEKQVGEQYGFEDIFNQALKVLRLPYYLGQPNHFDCSDLASQYCLLAGIDIGPLGQDPHLVAPNDLARQLGLLR